MGKGVGVDVVVLMLFVVLLEESVVIRFVALESVMEVESVVEDVVVVAAWVDCCCSCCSEAWLAEAKPIGV